MVHVLNTLIKSFSYRRWEKSVASADTDANSDLIYMEVLSMAYDIGIHLR